MVSNDRCLDLSVIPQFGGTCWFNAILMIALYSQNVRKVLMRTSKKWNKSNSFLMILKSILIKYYKQPEKVQDFFNKIRPETILFKMLKKMGEKAQIEYYKIVLKKDKSNLEWFNDFIIPFFKYINVNSLDIVYSNNEYYLETYNEFYYEYDSVSQKPIAYATNLNKYNTNANFLNLRKKEVFKEITKKIKKIPDILILRHEDLNPRIDKKNRIYHYIGKKISEFKSDKYNFDIQGLDTYEDIIYLNGHKYKLDAISLANYDKVNIGHSIAGITCNGNHYVYNGWNSTTTDPALVNKKVDVFKSALSPCSLIPYDWNLRKSGDFCLNSKTCKLDFFNVFKPHSRILCFSFTKGERILVYVRVDDDMKRKIVKKESIPNTLKLSDVSDVIKSVHDIKNLTDKELIIKLKKNKIPLNSKVKYERSLLEKLYYDYLKQIVNKEKNNFLKKDLIEIVKKNKPHLKGVAKLTKAQLKALISVN
jgi:hypothetical protein